MYCRNCGTQLEEGLTLCPKCNEDINSFISDVPVQPIKKKANVCSILAIIFGTIGIVPLINILFLPIAIILTIVGVCVCKNRGKKSMVASIIVTIISIIISALWMIPAFTGIEIPFFNMSETNSYTTTAVAQSTTANGSQVCSHSIKKISNKATCTSGGQATYKCTLCSYSYQEYESALGHTTTTGTCSRCGTSFGGWEIAYYVDEFNNPTTQAYIRNNKSISGTFSNSATTNSDLDVRILIDSEDICIKLWEYGRYEVNAYTTTYYNVTYLDEKGNKYYSTGTLYKNGDRICLADWKLVNLLQNNKQIKIYIEENSKYGVNSSYLFTVSQGNFNSIYSNYYNKYMD